MSCKHPRLHSRSCYFLWRDNFASRVPLSQWTLLQVIQELGEEWTAATESQQQAEAFYVFARYVCQERRRKCALLWKFRNECWWLVSILYNSVYFTHANYIWPDLAKCAPIFSLPMRMVMHNKYAPNILGVMTGQNQRALAASAYLLNCWAHTTIVRRQCLLCVCVCVG